jgi:hypothetical protein
VSATVEAVLLPGRALLQRYRDIPRAHADCYAADIDTRASLSVFVEAFYTTALFRCERFVLFLLGHGCADADVRACAAGATGGFAAWTVEERLDDQILLRDVTGLTRSWLMVAERADGRVGARLYFGSAVVPRLGRGSAPRRPSVGFRLLLPVHAIYARALLRAAAGRLTIQHARRESHAP